MISDAPAPMPPAPLGPSAERRALITTRPNPLQKVDYIVSLEGRIELKDGIVDVRLRYVPDRLLMEAASLKEYLSALGTSGEDRAEALAYAFLEDVNNEIVPRWLTVILKGKGQKVLMEDRQPNWGNEALLSRADAL